MIDNLIFNDMGNVMQLGEAKDEESLKCNDTAHMELPIELRFNDGHLVTIITYSILMVISAIGNISVLTIIKKRKSKSRIQNLVMHLSIADLFVSITTRAQITCDKVIIPLAICASMQQTIWDMSHHPGDISDDAIRNRMGEHCILGGRRRDVSHNGFLQDVRPVSFILCNNLHKYRQVSTTITINRVYSAIYFPSSINRTFIKFSWTH